MELVSSIVVGGLFAAGFYLVLRRSLMKLILGVAILSNAVNLLIFTAAGLERGNAPFVPENASAPEAPFADPLPQAFILTAIVIGFGVLAFAVALASRVFQVLGSDDTDQMRSDR